MKTREDLTLSGLVHDLNNVFQTLVDAADLLSGDPRYAKLSAAILRSVERGKNIAAGIQAGSGDGHALRADPGQRHRLRRGFRWPPAAGRRSALRATWNPESSWAGTGPGSGC